MKILTYIIISLLGMMSTQAQDIKERIHAETDKDFYLAGEQMGVKLHSTDVQGRPQEFSRVAYVELLGDGENAVRLKVEMKNAMGEAVVQLPYTLASGVYDLVAYTRWMRNEGEEVFFRRQIGIFNSLRYLHDTDQLVFMEGEAPASVEVPGNGNIQVKTDKLQYGNREKVTLSLEGVPDDARLSVSVVRKDVALGKKDYPALTQGRTDRDCQPELEGLILDARLEGAEENAPVLRPNLTIQGDYIRYYAGQQTADGLVHFYTTTLPGVTEVVTSTNGEGYLRPLSPFVATPPAQMRPVILYHQQKDALTERSIAIQAAEHFYPKVKIKEGVVRIDNWFSTVTPKWTFNLDEYKRFPTFKETFIEFMPCVRTMGKKGKRRIVAFDSDVLATSSGNTLVLLDGVVIMDHELLLAYDPHLVKIVEVYVEDFTFGDQLYNGILSVKTPNRKLSGFSLPQNSVVYGYEGVQPETDYPMPSAGEEVPRHLPDFRHTLYWNGHVSGTDKQLECRTSDMCGTYTVKVEGRTPDGKAICGYTCFEVK